MLASGHLLFSDRDALRIAAFDATSGQLLGEPLPLLDGVEFVALGGLQSASVAVARQGTMAYALRPRDPASALVWIDFEGTGEVREVKPTGEHSHVRVSPDGTRLVTSLGHHGIWVTDIATGAAQPVWQRGAAYQARWSPDGESLVFKLNGNLAVASARGGDEPETILDLDGYLTPFSWSTDGEIALVEGLGHGSDILILGADGKVREFRASEATETNPEISPDGRWIAYVSDIAGTPDVYIAALDGSQGQCAVTSGGGYTPAWSADSRRLFYARDGSLWVADLSGASCRTVSHRQLIDTFDVAKDFHQRHWDLLPDEQGIVFIDFSGRLAARAREIHVTLHGLDEIERMAGGS